MIRKTLQKTKDATFAIELPNSNLKGMHSPAGTGFFVSPDGWFITAAHVITQSGRSNGSVRGDLCNAWIRKETRLGKGIEPFPIACYGLAFEYIDQITDFALLKVDFQNNANKAWLKGKREDFPYIEISLRELEEGEPVYSFGYPLPESFVKDFQHVTISHSALCPRVTSAIISSTFEKQRMVMGINDPKVYVLDKALNYGNSGGPIIATETGKVHAFCSRFQPVGIPQGHLRDKQGNQLSIMIPSLYGIISSISNQTILQKLREKNIPISENS